VVRVPVYRSRSPGFDSRHYKIFWEAVSPERGPLSLVSTPEELLERKNCDSGLENRDYGHWNPLCWSCNTLYPQKLALTSPTDGCHLIGIIRSRTKATGFSFVSIRITGRVMEWEPDKDWRVWWARTASEGSNRHTETQVTDHSCCCIAKATARFM
jgi:hypothetical protein